jgi:hypothetical protein
MAASFRREADTNSGGSLVSSLQVNVPVGTITNDVMVALVVVGPSAGFLPTITAPIGWTSIRTDTDPGNNTLKQQLWYRVANSEPANYTWTFSLSVKAAGAIVTYANANTGGPIDDKAGQGNASSTSVTAPGVTTTKDSDTLLFLGSTNAGQAVSAPFGESQRVSNGTNTPGLGVGDDLLGNAGATGNRTGSTNTAAVNIGQLVALVAANSFDPYNQSLFTPKRRRADKRPKRCRRHRHQGLEWATTLPPPPPDLSIFRPKRRRTFKEVRRKHRAVRRHPFSDDAPLVPPRLSELCATGLVQETYGATALALERYGATATAQETYAAAASAQESYAATALTRETWGATASVNLC